MKRNVLSFISLCVVGCVMTYAQQMPGLLQKGKADTQDCKAWVDEQLSEMYYTTITGWLLLYFCKTLRGDFNGLDATAVGEQFGNLMNQPLTMFIFMAITVILCFGICSMGLQNGVEKITSKMMVALLILMVVLGINSIF